MKTQRILRTAGLAFMILLISLSGTQSVKAQVGVRLSYMKHSGELGYLLKPTMQTELYYEGYSNILFKYGLSLGYAPLKTYLDTVPLGTMYYGDSTVLLPSWMIYHNMKMYTIGFNLEYKILDRNFSPVVGTDVYFQIYEYNYEHSVSGESPSNIDELIVSMGILPRIGVVYDISDNFVIQGGIGKSLSVDHEFNKFLYWKIYCGVKYYFNN